MITMYCSVKFDSIPISITYLLRYFVEIPSAASGPSLCPTTLIYSCPSPAMSLNSGKCIQQRGAYPGL